MRLVFDSPWWLLALPLAALVPLVAAGGPGNNRWLPTWTGAASGMRAVATWIRTASVALLVLALAGPGIAWPHQRVDAVFLVDASDSVGSGGLDEGLDWVRSAVAAKEGDDRAALAVFGRRPGLAYGLRDEPPVGEDPAVVVDGSASDLEQALRLGHGALGSAERRRVVLLTDGRQTAGDVLAAASELAEAGVGLDVVQLDGGVASDVVIDGVDAPQRVREGEAYDVAVRLRNTGGAAADARLSVLADSEVVHRENLRIEPGSSTVSIARTAETGGTRRYEARLESGASTVAENDVGRAAVRVDGPPRVLVYEGADGLGDDVARALEAGGIGVDATGAAAEPLPPLDRLLGYDSIVLVDVPFAALGDAGAAALDSFVRDAGHGLVAIGGESSFALGEYDGTPLEDVLPVYARVSNPRNRPPVAQALVVDTSGSMAACHCSDPEASGPRPAEEGGVNKTDISREAVARAVRALEAQDIVGVLAFNTSNEWVIPLQHLPPEHIVDEGLARLHPDGNTDIVQAVRQAIDGLVDTDARLRHIVLFTDGFTENQALIDVAGEAADAGITLSVVGTGEGPREIRDTLREMASAGGGRYYPGRDLSAIPNIIALEVRFAARPVVNEGLFLPVVTDLAPATAALSEAPPLRGYLATTSKPTARTLLRIGEERDPLLATWRAGTGTATAWTSDTAPRWSGDWIAWDGFTSFWSDVVRDTFPAEADARGSASATAAGDGLHVRVDLADAAPVDAAGTATVAGPDGRRVEVPLLRTGVDSFEADLRGADGAALTVEGVYSIAVSVTQGEEQLYRGTATAIRSYPAEYAVTDDDGTLTARLAEAGARLDPEPAAVFDPEGLDPGNATRAIWPWLAALGLVLAPVDVGLRRLRLERADWGRARRRVAAWLPGRRGGGPPPPPAPRDAATEGLLAAKQRARRGRLDD